MNSKLSKNCFQFSLQISHCYHLTWGTEWPLGFNRNWFYHFCYSIVKELSVRNISITEFDMGRGLLTVKEKEIDNLSTIVRAKPYLIMGVFVEKVLRVLLSLLELLTICLINYYSGFLTFPLKWLAVIFTTYNTCKPI